MSGSTSLERARATRPAFHAPLFRVLSQVVLELGQLLRDELAHGTNGRGEGCELGLKGCAGNAQDEGYRYVGSPL